MPKPTRWCRRRCCRTRFSTRPPSSSLPVSVGQLQRGRIHYGRRSCGGSNRPDGEGMATRAEPERRSRLVTAMLVRPAARKVALLLVLPLVVVVVYIFGE